MPKKNSSELESLWNKSSRNGTLETLPISELEELADWLGNRGSIYIEPFMRVARLIEERMQSQQTGKQNTCQ